MLKKFFTVAYLFGPYAIQMSRSEKLFAAFSVLLLIISAIVYTTKRMSKDVLYRKIAGRWTHLTFWIGLLGVLWAALRYEAIEYLSANVIVLLFFLVGLIWAIRTLVYQLTTYRQLRMDYEKQEQKKKYM